MIQHQNLIHHAQANSLDETKRRWWADVCDKSDDKNKEEINVCAQYKVDMPCLKDVMTSEPVSKKRWWADLCGKDSGDEEEKNVNYAEQMPSLESVLSPAPKKQKK